MGQAQKYRNPRNKELRDLTWSLPHPIRVISPKGSILWQNQAAEATPEDLEWSKSPTTWQNKKAFLLVPSESAVADDVREMVDDLETVVDRLKRQQRDTARKKRQAEAKLQSGERELESLEKKQARLEERLAELEQENESLRGREPQQSGNLDVRVAELQANLQQATETIAEQTAQLEDSPEVASLETKISELEKELQQSRETSAADREKIDALRATVSELEKELQQSRETSAQEREQTDALRVRVSDLEKELQESRETSDNRQDSDPQDEIKALKTQISRLEDDKTSMEVWVEGLEQSRDAHDLELEKARQELAEIQTEYAAFKRQVEVADADRKLHEQLAAKVAEFEELERKLEEEQKTFDLQKAQLQERLSSQESELKELKDGFEATTTPDVDVEKLQTELEEARRAERRLQDKLTGLQDLKSERDALLDSVQADLKESHQREKELRETLKLYSEIRQEAEKSRGEAKTLRVKVEELEESHRALKQDLIKAKERLISGGGVSTSSGEGLSHPVKSQIDFLTKRLKDTEQKLDQSIAQLKEEKLRNQSSKESERLAFQDALTGLPNMNMARRYLNYARQQAATTGRGIGLFLINLDGFRVLNLTYGREWGDELLKAVGERLNGMRGGSHMVARHGQDHFMLLAAELDKNQLKTYVDQASRSLLEAIAYPFDVKGEQVKITCTIGIGVGPTQGDNPDQIFLQAESALQSAKLDGPGRYAMFDDRLRQSLKQESTYQTQMAYAIEKDEFIGLYQPVYSLTKKCVTGLELLTRWQHRDQTLLKPSVFLEPAIKSGLIMKITERLWPKALANLARWQRKRKGLTLSINLCDKELLSPSLLGKTVEWVQQAGVDPATVYFEVRDRSALRVSPAWWEVLQQYSQAGFGLCLDDYGSDASLFGTLAFHGFRQAKVTVDENALSLTRASQARKDFEFCAKGLQTKFDKKALAKAGFQSAQGYAVCRPIDAADVDETLS